MLFVTQLRIQRFFFAVVTNQKFDIFIMIIILLNMILMGLEHYEQSDEFENALYVVNTAFIVIFTTECVLKLISLRLYFFKQAWNVFDFVVVVVSVLGEYCCSLTTNCSNRAWTSSRRPSFPANSVAEFPLSHRPCSRNRI